jgi:hypothetical protein
LEVVVRREKSRECFADKYQVVEDGEFDVPNGHGYESGWVSECGRIDVGAQEEVEVEVEVEVEKQLLQRDVPIAWHA